MVVFELSKESRVCEKLSIVWRIAPSAAIVHAGAGSVHDLFSFLLFSSVNMELTSQSVSQLLYYFVVYSQVWKN